MIDFAGARSEPKKGPPLLAQPGAFLSAFRFSFEGLAFTHLRRVLVVRSIQGDPLGSLPNAKNPQWKPVSGFA